MSVSDSIQNITLDHALRATWQSISKMYNEMAKPYGVTMAVGLTLLNLDPKNGISSTALGPMMGMESTSLSRLINNLEDLNLIERRQNPVDKRGVHIHLTSLGLEKRDLIKEHVLNFNQRVTSKLSAEDIKGYFKTIEMLENVSSEIKSTLNPE